MKDKRDVDVRERERVEREKELKEVKSFRLSQLRLFQILKKSDFPIILNQPININKLN